MYLSLDWLKDFVDIPRSITADDLGLRLTMHTVEIDGVEKEIDRFKNVVIGKILEVKKHLDWLIGPDTAIAHYRELGIIRKYRNGIEPVYQLFAHSLPEENTSEVQHSCFWTSKKSRLFPIMTGLGGCIAYNFDDEMHNVFMFYECAQSYRQMKMPIKKIAAMIAARCRQLGVRR